jgi:hypothetical protein
MLFRYRSAKKACPVNAEELEMNIALSGWKSSMIFFLFQHCVSRVSSAWLTSRTVIIYCYCTGMHVLPHGIRHVHKNDKKFLR